MTTTDAKIPGDILSFLKKNGADAMVLQGNDKTPMNR
jgi:hypothetical protein